MAEQTFYYEYPSGALTQVVTTAADPVHPEGAKLLTQEEYAAKLAAAQAAEEQRQADIRAAEEARKRTAYEALVGSGIAPEAASILSGYTPPDGEVQ